MEISDSDPILLNVRNEFHGLSAQEIKEIYSNNSKPDGIIALNITGDLNVGMSIRTSSLFGMSKFYTLGRRFYDRRTTVGQHNYISMEHIPSCKGSQNEELDTDIAVSFLINLSTTHNIIFVEQGGLKLNEMKKNISEKPCYFVVGNEGTGIPKEIIERVPGIIVEIPQRGVGRSHNVANALSMVLWEYYRDTF